MKILGIDTTTKKANVCVLNNDLVTSKSIDNEITHSEKLLPLIDDCIKESNISLKDMDYLACTIGPGSFTGVRIGIATIKAFAKVISKSIFAVSSLELLAYSKVSDNNSYIVSMLDSKNSRVYYSMYKVAYINETTYLETVISPANDNIDIALSNIKLSVQGINDSQIIFTGDIIELYNDNILDIFPHSDTFTSTLKADAIISMVKNSITTNTIDNYLQDYLTLDAMYVRPSQAERTQNGQD